MEEKSVAGMNYGGTLLTGESQVSLTSSSWRWEGGIFASSDCDDYFIVNPKTFSHVIFDDGLFL